MTRSHQPQGRNGEDNHGRTTLQQVSAGAAVRCSGAVAEFERALIGERQLEGIALAKTRGAYRGGWRRLSEELVAELRRRTDAGEEKSALAREFDISDRRCTAIFERSRRPRDRTAE